MDSNALLRKFRLTEKEDFNRAFTKGKRDRNNWLLIYSIGNNLEYPRLAVVISRKNVPKANQRNRIRRQFKELFRVRRTNLCSRDFVVVVHKEALKYSQAELKLQIISFWESLTCY